MTEWQREEEPMRGLFNMVEVTSREKAIRQALIAEFTERTIEVAGTCIKFNSWDGPDSAPPVLLVHGFLAHMRWWDPIAVWLAEGRRVVALDFSGMGDSGWRQSYSRALHAQEIFAVACAAGLHRAILVAHSYGGDPAIRCCSRFPELFSRLVLLDCRLTLPGVAPVPRKERQRPRIRTTFPTVETAMTRFRLLPESPLADPVMRDHVARHSVTQWEGQWAWKFDAAMETDADPSDPLDTSPLELPIAFVRGEESVVTTPHQMAITREYLPQALQLTIPATGHHVMLEQPVALATLLRGLLVTNW